MGVRELGLPMPVPAAGPAGPLPERVTIWEVGPRDGLQNEKTVVGLDTKLEFLGRLADAGLRVIEATSFVHPKWVPQLADAEDLLARLDRRPGVAYPVLVPNERGLDRALAAGPAAGTGIGRPSSRTPIATPRLVSVNKTPV